MISFLLSYLSLYSNVSAAEPVVQNLEYALSVADQKIGTRTVKTTYFIDEKNKQANRRIIEVYTEMSGGIFGNELVFKERSSIEYDGRDIKFVSTQSLNDDPIEFQGRNKRDGSWMIYEISNGVSTQKTYTSRDFYYTTLSMYDNKRSQQMQDLGSMGIYIMEKGEVWSGVWRAKGNKKVRIKKQKILGQQYEFSHNNTKIEGVWSDNGELLKFTISYNGIDLDGKLTEPPKVLEIGTIDNIGDFQGVKEEEL
jgi:hypothetical protein